MPAENRERLQGSAGEPRKAYLIRWSIANDMEALIYADSATDAMRRFENGEDVASIENTGNDWRCRQPKAKRWPDEDR